MVLENPQGSPNNSDGNAIALEKSLTFTLVLSSILASLGSFNFGYNLSVVNTTAKSFNYCPAGASVWQCFPVSKYEWGLVAGLICLGAVVGCFVGGPLSNRLGRKKAVILTNIPYLIGYLLLAVAQNLSMLLAGRLLAGIGVGMACVSVPLYLTEISSVGARGLIGSFHQMAISVGILTGELVALTGLYRPLLWRLMFGLPMISCIVQIFGMLFYAPESPPFLISHLRRPEDGRQALKRLRGNHYKEAEVQLFQKTTAKAKDVEVGEQSTTSSWTLVDLLFRRVRIAGWSLIIASILHLAQQLSGINSLLLFSDSIFNPPTAETGNVNPITAPPSLVPAAIAGLNFLMSIASISVIDRLGRRFLVLVSSVSMALAGFVLTGAFFFKLKVISIIAVLCFVGGFAFGLGPVPWLMTSELFPTEAAGAAVSFAVSLNWLSNWAVTSSFPTISDILKSFAFLPYALCTTAFFLFLLFYLPETKGRPVGFI